MSISLESLPKLPAGWHYEPHDFDEDVVHVVWPEHGAMSLHFKRRVAVTGWAIPRLAAHEDARPTGKGWQAALVADAVATLKAAWE